MQINITEWLEQAAAAHPGRAAYSDKDSSIEFGTLRRYARSIGTAVAGEKRASQARGGILRQTILTPAAFLGAAYAGASTPPSTASSPPQG